MSTTFAIPENPPGSQPVDAPSVWQRFAPDLPAERVMWSEIVPGGCHWSWVMPRGSRLRMVARQSVVDEALDAVTQQALKNSSSAGKASGMVRDCTAVGWV